MHKPQKYQCVLSVNAEYMCGSWLQVSKTWRITKLNQMSKSTDEAKMGIGERDQKQKNQNEKYTEAHSLPFFFFSPVFQKAKKLTGRGRGNTKACVLIFSFRAPPGPLKLLWFPQSNYISTLNPSRIATSHQGTLSAYKRSMPNGVPEVDFISLLQSNGL